MARSQSVSTAHARTSRLGLLNNQRLTAKSLSKISAACCCHARAREIFLSLRAHTLNIFLPTLNTFFMSRFRHVKFVCSSCFANSWNMSSKNEYVSGITFATRISTKTTWLSFFSSTLILHEYFRAQRHPGASSHTLSTSCHLKVPRTQVQAVGEGRRGHLRKKLKWEGQESCKDHRQPCAPPPCLLLSQLMNIVL